MVEFLLLIIVLILLFGPEGTLAIFITLLVYGFYATLILAALGFIFFVLLLSG